MADDYETIRMLGGGAGGSAYLTRRRCDGQHVVIKRVPLKGLSRSEARYAQSELAVMRSLDAHPFVVRFYDSFEAASIPLGAATAMAGGGGGGGGADELHLVMEYCAGGTLQDRIDAARKQQHKAEVIPAAEVLRLFSQIALGVHALHSVGILHRDLKAENVFLAAGSSSGGGGETVKLGDFGLSRQLEGPLDVATTTVGTPHHLSPELCSGQSYGSASDIWALGCILHELATLQWLVGHDGQSLPQIVMALMRAIGDRTGDEQGTSADGSSSSSPLRQRYLQILASRYGSASAAAAAAAGDGEGSGGDSEGEAVVGTFDALLQGCLAKEPSHRQTAAGLLIRTPMIQAVADAQSCAHGLPLVAQLLQQQSRQQQQQQQQRDDASANATEAASRRGGLDLVVTPEARAHDGEGGAALEVEEEEIVDEWPPSPVLHSSCPAAAGAATADRGGGRGGGNGAHTDRQAEAATGLSQQSSYDTNGDGCIDGLDTNGDGIIDTRLGHNGSRTTVATDSADLSQNASATGATSNGADRVSSTSSAAAGAVESQGKQRTASGSSGISIDGNDDDEEEEEGIEISVEVEVDSSTEILQSLEFDASPSPKLKKPSTTTITTSSSKGREQRQDGQRDGASGSATENSWISASAASASASSSSSSMSVSMSIPSMTMNTSAEEFGSNDEVIDEFEVEAEDYADDDHNSSGPMGGSTVSGGSSSASGSSRRRRSSGNKSSKSSVAWSIESEKSDAGTWQSKPPAESPITGSETSSASSSSSPSSTEVQQQRVTEQRVAELEALLAAANDRLGTMSADLAVSQRRNRRLVATQKEAKRIKARLARLEAQMLRLGIPLDLDLDEEEEEDDEEELGRASDEESEHVQGSPAAMSVTTSRIVGL